MVRLGPIVLALSVAACTGEILSQNLEGLPPEEQVALSKWVDKALPVFGVKCTTGCHDGTMPNIGYIAGTDDLMKRETLINYVPRVVNLGAPQSSRILTKGDHTATGGGPALDVTEASAILEWIVAEREARAAPTVIRTAQMTAQICTSGAPPDPTCPLNTIDLAELGTAATLEFAVSAVGTDAYFTNLKIKAGAGGLYFEHPLLESWPAGETMPKPDPVDRFFAVSGNLAANAEQVIGETGTASLAGFTATDPVSVRFDVFEVKRP